MQIGFISIFLYLFRSYQQVIISLRGLLLINGAWLHRVCSSFKEAWESNKADVKYYCNCYTSQLGSVQHSTFRKQRMLALWKSKSISLQLKRASLSYKHLKTIFALSFLVGSTTINLSCFIIISCRVWFNDFQFVFHNSSWRFHKPYFSRKHILHESHRVKRTQDYGLKTCKQVPNCLTLS